MSLKITQIFFRGRNRIGKGPHYGDQLSNPIPKQAHRAFRTRTDFDCQRKNCRGFCEVCTELLLKKLELKIYRFTVNLHTASADFSGNDVPLHISVRFDEGKVKFFTKNKFLYTYFLACV